MFHIFRMAASEEVMPVTGNPLSKHFFQPDLFIRNKEWVFSGFITAMQTKAGLLSFLQDRSEKKDLFLPTGNEACPLSFFHRYEKKE